MWAPISRFDLRELIAQAREAGDSVPRASPRALGRISYDYTGGTIGGLKATSLEIGGIEDHVHILAKLPPKIAVSDFLEKLKAKTSNYDVHQTPSTGSPSRNNQM